MSSTALLDTDELERMAMERAIGRLSIIVRGVLRDTLERCAGAEFDIRVQARSRDLIRDMPWPEEWRAWLMRKADTGQLLPVPAADPPGLWEELVQRCYDVGSRGVAAFYLLRQVELVRILRAKEDQ